MHEAEELAVHRADLELHLHFLNPAADDNDPHLLCPTGHFRHGWRLRAHCTADCAYRSRNCFL